MATSFPPIGLHPAKPGDVVGGRPARLVARPATAAGVAEILTRCAYEGLTVAPRGGGTKIDWGPVPPRLDVLLDLAGLTGPWEHQPENLIATFPAGTPVRAAKAGLIGSGQRLTVDPGSVGGTIGGLLATDEAGPLRHRFGAPSRQLVSIQAALPDGGLATLGPELAPLVCGSSGALGVITSATFRTAPHPARRLWLTKRVRTPLELRDLLGELATCDVPLSAVEVDLPAVLDPGTLCVLLEGEQAVVGAAQAAVTDLLGTDVQARPAGPSWWGSYPFEPPGDLALRITVPPADVHAAIYALRDAAGRAVPCRGSAGVGTVYAALPGTLPVGDVAGILDATRHTLLGRGGSLVVLRAPLPHAEALDLAGAAPDPAALGYRLKTAFDPTGLLARDWPAAR